MEKIRINEINKKDSGLVVVKYNQCDMLQTPNLEATLNTKWQAQQVDYLINDVGIGGTVDVLIEEKESNGKKYINITNLDFTSAVKGQMTILEKNVAGIPVDMPKQEKFRTPTEMVATELTCALLAQTDTRNVITILDAVKMYKGAVKLLDE